MQGPRFGVQGPVESVQGSEFRVQGSGFRASFSELGCRVHGQPALSRAQLCPGSASIPGPGLGLGIKDLNESTSFGGGILLNMCSVYSRKHYCVGKGRQKVYVGLLVVEQVSL